jgi:hypothetical protein
MLSSANVATKRLCLGVPPLAADILRPQQVLELIRLLKVIFASSIPVNYKEVDHT